MIGAKALNATGHARKKRREIVELSLTAMADFRTNTRIKKKFLLNSGALRYG